VFSTHPRDSVTDSPVLGVPVVSVVGEDGERVGSSNATVTLTVTGPGPLEGSTQATAANGMAEFPGLLLATPGPGYVLHASSPGLVGADSQAFSVSPAWLATSPRRPIVITAAADALEPGYALAVRVDLGSLVAAGQALASGDDLRVSFWNGEVFVQLNRVLWPSERSVDGEMDAWFRLREQLGADETDTRYAIHYGNQDAGLPPADGSQVFTLWEDFSGNTVDQAKWNRLTSPSATVQVQDGRLRMSASWVPWDERFEAVGVASRTALAPGFQVMCTFGILDQDTTAQRNFNARLGLPSDTRGLAINSEFDANKRVQYWDTTWHDVGDSSLDARVLGSARIRQALRRDGVAIHQEDGVVRATRVTGNATTPRTLYFSYAPDTYQVAYQVWFDDIAVRPYVSSDPDVTVTLDPEVLPP
jgi:hypothetical protein